MLRIIAGEYGGRRIEAPKGHATRPTSERVREALFSIISNRVQDAVVLDLFAGSGALGLEALSRGAKQAIFVELGREAYGVIKRNVEIIGCMDRVMLINRDYKAALESLARMKASISIVFLDPPYAQIPNILSCVLEELKDSLEDDAVIILEHSQRTAVEIPESWIVSDERKYGDIRLSFIQRRQSGE